MALRSFKRWFEGLFKHRKNADPRALEPLETASSSTLARPYNEPHRVASICLLPEDMLFMICQYLTPGEIITFMLSCAGFWRERDRVGVFADVWQRITQSENDPGKMRVLFYALRMLEYDGLLQRGSPRKYSCWGCVKAHERRYFSPEEFQKTVDLQIREDFLPSEEFHRSCPLGKRCILFTHGCEMNLMEIRHAAARSPTEEIAIYTDSSVADICFPSLDAQYFVRGDNVLQYRITIAGAQVSYSTFKQRARYLDYPLCPHVRMGDEEIIHLYYQPGETGYFCKSCPTHIRIFFRSALYVTVLRHLGPLCSPSNSIWLAQSYTKRRRWLKRQCSAFIPWVGFVEPWYIRGDSPRVLKGAIRTH